MTLESWFEIVEVSNDSLQPRLTVTAEEDPAEGHHADLLNVDQNLDKILTTLKTIESCHYHSFAGEKYNIYLSKLVILLGEQLGHGPGRGSPWTNDRSRSLSRKIIEQINRIFNFGQDQGQDIGQLFNHDMDHHFATKKDDENWSRKTIFWPIIVDFKSKLKRGGSSGVDIALDQEWKYYPAAQTSFCWILKAIKSPFLTEFLEFVLPPTLLFLDDYNDDNVLLGFECLSHILENSNDADMINFNRGKVIYSALIRLLSSKNPQIIDYLVPIILKILGIIEKDPNLNASRFSQYDDAVKLILFDIEFGTSGDVQLRKTWLTNLQLILKALGLSTLHWSDKILNMFLDFSVSNDPQIWTLILENIQLVLKNTWTNPDINQMLEIILRILFNSSVFQMDQENIMNQIIITLQLIDTCSPAVFREEIEIILEKFDQKLHPQFIFALNELMKRMKLDQK